MSPTATKKTAPDPATPEEIDEIAALMRETYCLGEGGVLADHLATHDWESLSDERRQKWRAMATAVLERLSQ